MNLKAGSLEYEWIENWGNQPKADGFAHHGMALSKTGEIYTADGAEPIIRVMTQGGEVVREFETPVGENHCISLAEEDGKGVLWLSDTGPKGGAEAIAPPRVIKCDLDGNLLAEITMDDLDYAEDESFVPTAVDVDPDGNVYIANGYGSGKVHCLGSDLKLKWTLDGTTGAGRFKQPHWVYCDTRGPETLIYVADRRNHRIQVFTTEGEYVKVIDGFLNTPSAITGFGDKLVVAELEARLVILDENDELVDYLGDGREHTKKQGWPNRKSDEGVVSDPLGDIPVGQFNSPHGVVASPDGDIFISEWLLGDRFIKLKRVG